MPQLAITGGPGRLTRVSPHSSGERPVESILDLVRSAESAARPPLGRDSEAARVLQAARSVLQRSRFRSLKIRQVMITANTSASGFYRHFPSKSHLLLALLEDEIARGDRKLAELLAREDCAQARLRTWLTYHIRIIYQPSRAERARMFLDPTLLQDLPEQVDRLYEVAGQRLATVIGEGMADRVFRPGDPVADAAMIRNLVQGLIANGLTGRLHMSESEALRMVHGFVLNALHPVSLRDPAIVQPTD